MISIFKQAIRLYQRSIFWTEVQDIVLSLLFHQDSEKLYFCFILMLSKTSLQYHPNVRTAYLLRQDL